MPALATGVPDRSWMVRTGIVEDNPHTSSTDWSASESRFYQCLKEQGHYKIRRSHSLMTSPVYKAVGVT